MKSPDKRTTKLLATARKAVSRITNPTVRAKATAKLNAAQKKITNPRQPERSQASARQRIRGRDHDRDFER